MGKRIVCIGVLCVTFIAQSTFVFGQSVRFSETYDHPNGGAGILEDVVVTNDGNFLVIGNSLNFGTGLRDAHHLVVDGEGQFITEVSLETDSFEINPQAIIKSNYNGGFYVSGYWCNYLSSSPGPCDFYFSRLDETGDTLFTRIIERPDTSDFVLDLVETRPNKLMLIGWTYNDTTDADADLLFITVDTLGNELNRVVYGGGGTDFVSAGVVVDSIGNVVMAGYTRSFPSVSSNIRTWVVKTDSIGNVKWHRTYSGSVGPSSSAARITQLANGNLLIAGGNENYGSSFFGVDGTLLEIDTAGNQIWATEYEVEGGQGLWGVVGLDDGTIVACGVTDDGNGGSQAGWLIKTDASGDTLWTRTFNTSPYIEYLRNMLVMPNGDIVMVGFGRGENSTTQDGWILRVDSMGCLQEGCFSVGIDEQLTIDDVGFSMYPNPFTNEVTIAYTLSQDCSEGCFIRIVDVQGRVVFEQSVLIGEGSGSITLDMKKYETGLYICSLYNHHELLQTARLIRLE